MAELQDPAYLAGGCITAQGDRQVLSSLVCEEGVAFGASGGGDLEVTQRGAGANMSVDVASGNAFIQGTVVGWQGMYHVTNDATENIVIPAADPTNPRIDLIIARVRDAQYAGVTDDWSLDVVTGTANPAPVAPAVPDNSLVLAHVAVAAAAASIVTANITDTRAGYVRCAGNTELVTFTATSAFVKADYPGLIAVKIRLVGPGGGGGGASAADMAAGGGGGGGGYAEAYVMASALAASETVTVGTGGAGGGGAAVGSAGSGPTSFGAHCVASAGSGGDFITAAVDGAYSNAGIMGVGTTGDLLLYGGAGERAFVAGVSLHAAAGGDTPLGQGGAENMSFNSEGLSLAGNPPLNYGGGGGGALNSGGGNDTGGTGADGVVLVELVF